MSGDIRSVGHRHRLVGMSWCRKGHGGHEVPADKRSGITEFLTLIGVLGFDRGPGGIRCGQEPLTAELRVHAIVDLVEPVPEGVWGL